MVDIEELENATDLYVQGILDSLDILVVIEEINAAFDIEITGSDFSRNDFRTVEDIYNMVERCRQKS